MKSFKVYKKRREHGRDRYLFVLYFTVLSFTVFANDKFFVDFCRFVFVRSHSRVKSDGEHKSFFFVRNG